MQHLTSSAYDGFPRILTFLMIFLAVAAVTPSPSAASDAPDAAGPTTLVKLAIYSDGPGTLSCTIILAHFVTQALAPSADGFTLILFDRDGTSGALTERRSGRSMLVENILCGDKYAWQATYSDIPLTLLRPAGSSRFEARCRLETRLRCTVEAVDS